MLTGILIGAGAVVAVMAIFSFIIWLQIGGH